MHFLNVTASDSPVTNVYVHYLPVEAGDVGLRLALLPFGTVHEVTYQRFTDFKDISTGTRIVRMLLDHHVPFQSNIQGYPCRVWYAGQPLSVLSVRVPIKLLTVPIGINAGLSPAGSFRKGL